MKASKHGYESFEKINLKKKKRSKAIKKTKTKTNKGQKASSFWSKKHSLLFPSLSRKKKTKKYPKKREKNSFYGEKCTKFALYGQETISLFSFYIYITSLNIIIQMIQTKENHDESKTF